MEKIDFSTTKTCPTSINYTFLESPGRFQDVGVKIFSKFAQWKMSFSSFLTYLLCQLWHPINTESCPVVYSVWCWNWVTLCFTSAFLIASFLQYNDHSPCAWYKIHTNHAENAWFFDHNELLAVQQSHTKCMIITKRKDFSLISSVWRSILVCSSNYWDASRHWISPKNHHFLYFFRHWTLLKQLLRCF